jgi:hypothetical protein
VGAAVNAGAEPMIALRRDRTSFLESDLPRHQPQHPCGFAGGLWDSSLWTGLGHWEGWRFDPPLSWVLWRRWSWGLRSWIAKQKFRCHACGQQCPIAPIGSGFWRSTAICSECCPDHDYEYFRDLGMWACVHCNADAPDDFYCD